MKDNECSKKEYLGYGIGGFGKGIISAFVATFILIYFTDAVLIPPAAAGAIITIAKVAVMIILPFAGAKMDATRSRFGRFRPYLLWLSLIMGLVTVMCFISPELLGITDEAAKIIICFALYLLWEVAFNLHDVPFWAIASVVSEKENVRSVFLSVANVVTTFSGAVPILIVPFVLSAFGNAKGYAVSGAIFGVAGTVFALGAFFGTKERVTSNDTTASFKDRFKALFKTKPMFIFNLALLLASGVFCVSSAQAHVGKYLYATDGSRLLHPGGEPSIIPSDLFLTLLMMLWGGGMGLSEAIFPIVYKKYELKKSFFIFALIAVVVSLAGYFLGYDKLGKASIYVFLAFYLAMGFLCGAFFSLRVNLIPECTDYSEWQSGIRQDGLFFSTEVMISQILEATPVMIVALMLQLSGYQEPEGDVIIAQTETVKNAVFSSVTLVPAVGMLLSLIPLAFYTYSGENKKKILKELQEKRAEGKNA